jgi:hypothetical protein
MNLTEREKELIVENLKRNVWSYEESIDRWRVKNDFDMVQFCKEKISELEALIEKVKAA